MSTALIRVAVVDDHPSITWGVERLIDTASEEMENVGSAHDLDTARILLRTMVPDVVLLDLDIAGVSSAPLVSEFMSLPTRFLLFTGVRDESLHDAALMAGARGVLSKAEAPDRILRAIRSVAAGELWIERGRIGLLVDRLRKQASDKTPDPFATLTRREREILAVVVTDISSPTTELAARLHISERTLRNALSTIYGKTGALNRLHLYSMAGKHAQQ